MEELKLVLEAMQTMGADAKTAFIVYVLANYVLGSLAPLTGFITFMYFSYKMGVKAMSYFTFSGVVGKMFNYEDMDDYDRKSVINQIAELQRVVNEKDKI